MLLLRFFFRRFRFGFGVLIVGGWFLFGCGWLHLLVDLLQELGELEHGYEGGDVFLDVLRLDGLDLRGDVAVHAAGGLVGEAAYGLHGVEDGVF